MATCIITGKIVNGSEVAIEGAKVVAATSVAPAIVTSSGAAISPLGVEVYTDSSGDFEITLIQLVEYIITIPSIHFRENILIPAEATAVLWSLSAIDETGEEAPTEDETKW